MSAENLETKILEYVKRAHPELFKKDQATLEKELLERHRAQWEDNARRAVQSGLVHGFSLMVDGEIVNPADHTCKVLPNGNFEIDGTEYVRAGRIKQ